MLKAEPHYPATGDGEPGDSHFSLLHTRTTMSKVRAEAVRKWREVLTVQEQTFSKQEVEKHTSEKDAWVIIEGGVYDV